MTTVSEDTTPSSFSFSSVSNAQLSYVYTSSTITVTGINTGTQVTIDG
ncbi:MAG: hypothetical protein Q8O99_06850 [bacterium]|nr:hypothetical protein [bacterium]